MKRKTNDVKLQDALSDNKVKCSRCGHTMNVLPTNPKVICDYCGTLTRNNTIARFRYNMYKLLRNR